MSVYRTRSGKSHIRRALAVVTEPLERRTLLSAAFAAPANEPGTTAGSIIAAGDPISVTQTFPVVATERNSSGRVPLALFSFATAPGSPPLTASDFSATVDWGDGSGTSAGAVSGTEAEGFVVSGEHGYALEGQYPVAVRIAGPAGALGEGTTNARVVDAVVLQPRVDLNVASGRHAAADFNNDGAPDLITASDLQYTVLLNSGNGFLAPRPSVTLPGTTRNGAMRIVTADFNRDGKQDAAISLLGHTGVADQLAVMLGRGDGTFTTANVYQNIGGDDIEAGDVNGDAIPDLAAVFVNRSGGNAGVGILQGRGDGSFNAAPTVSVPTLSVDAVELKDFSGDGKADVVAADWLGGKLFYAEGNGDGTFATPAPIPLPLRPATWGFAVTSGDFNGDGKPDVIAAQSLENQLAVVLNNGDGTFDAPVLSPLKTAAPTNETQWVFFLHAFDMNGDGALDLVRGDAATHSVIVRLGRGDGTFLPDQRIDVKANYFVDVAAADFNRDGRTDLAAGQLSILLSTPLVTTAAAPGLVEGSETGVLLASFFHDEVTAPAGNYSATVDWGDGASSTGTVVAAPGGGFEVRGAHRYRRQGDYAARITILGPGGARTAVLVTVAVADAPLTVAGATPVFAVENTSTGLVPLGTFSDADAAPVFGPYTVNIRWGDGQTSPGTAEPVPGGPAGRFVVRGSHTYATEGDYNVAAEIIDAEGGARTALETRARVVDPYFALPAVQYPAPGAGMLASGDVNGDGVPDFVTGIDNTISVLMGRGDGTLTEPATMTLGVNIGSLALGDFDGDRKLDLMHAVIPLGGGSTPPRTTVLLGNGDGTFRAGAAADVYSFRLAVADFNNDGKLDAVTSGTPAGPGLMLGRGDGTFAVSSIPLAGSHSYEAFVTGDFNGDGKVDLAASRNQSSLGEPNQVIVLAGRGDGTFAGPAAYPLPTGQPVSSMYLATGDLDGDGKADLVATDPYRRLISVLLNKGDGTFAGVPDAPIEVPAATGVSYSGQPAVADFNGDGLGDLVMPNGADNTVRVRLGRGDGTFMPDARSPVAPMPGAGLVVTDLNGDGFPDVAVSNIGSGTVSVLLGSPARLAPAPTVQAREGAEVVGVLLGTLTFRDPPQVIAAIPATVDWGDGTRSAAVLTPAGNGSFEVRGTHLYPRAGTYGARVVVDLPHGLRPAATTPITVADAPVDAAPVAVSAPQATPFTSVVARFTDVNPFGSADEFSAMVDWADGRAPTPGVVVFERPGNYAVLATNKFNDVGTRVIRVNITSEHGSQAVASPQVAVVAPRDGGGSISGVVFDDADGDGVREFGEGGLAGRTVYIDGNGNGTLDANERTALTSAAGDYSLADVPAGNWTVRQLLRTGDRETAPAGGSGQQIILKARQVVAGVDLGALRAAPAIAGRNVFYNASAFDGNSQGVGGSDDGAVARDKHALLPGQTVAATNVTSYTRGINGVMIDIASSHGPLTAADFQFRVGKGGDAGAWAAAPAPTSVSVRQGAGAGGTDRVTFTWADGAIRNQWLQVTVLANPNTRLTTPDVFYFGNLVADTNGDLRVNALDLGSVKRALNQNADVTGRFDFNRDGRVNSLDLAVAKANLNHRLTPTAASVPVAAANFAGAPATARLWDEALPDLLA
jgi:hypothetical protein